MTIEQAIKELKGILPQTTAINLAIKALEQEPCEDWYDVPSDEMTLEQARQAVKDLRKKLAEHLEQDTSPDCISRQAVLACKQTFTDNAGYDTEFVDIEDIEALAPVTPQQKIGRWINIDATHSKCDRCGAVFEIASENGEANYCPNCGNSKMQEVKE